MQLEVCCYHLSDAILAQKMGVHRIELCANAAVGGVSASQSELEKAAKELHIPTHIMIRPRGGNLVFSAAEIDAMLLHIQMVQRLGFAGIVVGALTTNNTIDIATMQYIVRQATQLQITFHKAFDATNCSLDTMDKIIELGCHNVLTTMGKPSIEQGIKQLISLKKAVSSLINVIACGGVRSQHIPMLQEAGFLWVHAAPLTAKGRLDTNELDKMLTLL